MKEQICKMHSKVKNIKRYGKTTKMSQQLSAQEHNRKQILPLQNIQDHIGPDVVILPVYKV